MAEQFAPAASQLGTPALGALAVAAAPTAGQGLALDATGRLPVGVPAQEVVVLTADPAHTVVGQIWYRSDTSQLCVQQDATTVKRVTFT